MASNVVAGWTKTVSPSTTILIASYWSDNLIDIQTNRDRRTHLTRNMDRQQPDSVARNYCRSSMPTIWWATAAAPFRKSQIYITYIYLHDLRTRTFTPGAVCAMLLSPAFTYLLAIMIGEMITLYAHKWSGRLLSYGRQLWLRRASWRVLFIRLLLHASVNNHMKADVVEINTATVRLFYGWCGDS